jgi:hypothetical protein
MSPTRKGGKLFSNLSPKCRYCSTLYVLSGKRVCRKCEKALQDEGDGSGLLYIVHLIKDEDCAWPQQSLTRRLEAEQAISKLQSLGFDGYIKEVRRGTPANA